MDGYDLRQPRVGSETPSVAGDSVGGNDATPRLGDRGGNDATPRYGINDATPRREASDAVVEGWPVPTQDDRLYNAMFLQNMLQVAILGSKVFNRDMTDSVRESLAVGYLMGLFSETSEALKAIRFMPMWDKHQTDLNKVRAEVIDAFHHVMNLAIILWGVDSDAFYKAYRTKWTQNFKRATKRNAVRW